MSTWILRRPSLPTLAWWRQWRPELSTEMLVAGATLFFALACNGLFWRSAMAVHPGSLRLAAALFLLLVGVHGLLLGLLVWRWNARVMLTLLLLVSLAAAHYMGRYHIYLDADMLRNILATDLKESGELITPSLLWPLALAAMPAWCVWRIRLRGHTIAGALLRRSILLLVATVAIACGGLLASQDVSSLLRGHREVRYLATPANILVGLPRVLRGDNPTRMLAGVAR